jgi:arylsulfatase A-like enzyme
MDEQIGRVLHALREAGDAQNTLIVFSSDHGLAIGSHGLMGKQNLYEHSMKSPLVIAGPGIRPGHSEALAYLHDIYPTLCDLAGIGAPDGLDGRSLSPVVGGQSPGVRNVLFLAYRDVQRAVRQGDWKLIRYPKVGKTQLFNLVDDPDELNDLADDPRQAPRVGTLMELLARQQALAGDPIPHTVENPDRADVDLSYFPTPAPRQPAH